MDAIAIEVPLTRGKIALISPEDAERVLAFKWCASPAGSGLWYAVRGTRREDGAKTTQGMHRFILGCDGQIDHGDGNGLNNQRSNIQEATSSLNNHRRHVRKSNSGFYGVSKHAWGGFCAYLTCNKKTNYLGIFKTAEQAALRYDQAAKRAYGEMAMLNFPNAN